MGIFEDDFCDILRKARFGRGVSVGALAAATGVPPGRIEALESGESSPPPARSEVEALARALGLGEAALWHAAAGLRRPAIVEGLLPLSWELRRFTFPGLNSNGYILADRAAGAALLVDPGGLTPEFMEAVTEPCVPLRAVLITHGHSDHVEALPWVRERLPGVPVVAHPLTVRSLGIRGPVCVPQSEDELQFDGIRVQVWFTPGHSADGLCFRVGPAVFVGDTLFAGSLGRSERGPATYAHLLKSARRLLDLPAATVLLPGHGPPTTVAAEATGNPFLTSRDGGEVVKEEFSRDG